MGVPRDPAMRDDSEFDRMYEELTEVMADRNALWRVRAACRDADVSTFYPQRGDMKAIRAAAAMCAVCPVTEECQRYAAERGIRLGIWAGQSGRTRRTAWSRHGYCRLCDGQFVVGRPGERYCSDDCRQQAHRDSSARSYRRRVS